MIIRRISPKITAKRVAAYARVSTLAEAQEESYETQVNYYSDMISGTAGWEFAGMYADQGITGTSATKRPQFMKMLEDARDGRIDLILCKSISRFSRNFVDAQRYIHELKAINVEVRFEKEGIKSLDPGSDLIFSLMAAIAQEESRSISENVKWSYQRLAEQGIRHVGNNHMLGFDEVDGKLTPNIDAWIVRMMFDDYAKGLAPSTIIRHLQEAGAKRLHSDRCFTWSAILAILKNEAYVGDRLIQKTAPQDYLTKKPDPTVEYESRFIRNDHEGIVSRELWNKAQQRLARDKLERENGLFSDHRSHFLYGRVFCAECGEPYRRFTAQVVSGTHKVWRCRGRISKNGCHNKQIDENELMRKISQAIGSSCTEESVYKIRVQISEKEILIEKATVAESA